MRAWTNGRDRRETRRLVSSVVSSVRACVGSVARDAIEFIDLIHYMGTGAVPMRHRVVVRASTPSSTPSTPSPSSKPTPSTTTTTMTRGGVSIRFERCRREDLARVTTMERASYPADEAASAVRLEMRQREAGEFFMVARAVDSMDSSGEGARASDASGTAATERAALDADARSIVGYVCGTLASGDVLDESTMSSHDPSGDVLAIHSVCVDERFRRRGVAASALAHYVARWIVHDETQNENDDTTTTTTKVRRVRLLCKENLIPFYERYGGFALEGASAVEHGAETWFDMVLDLA